MFLYSENVISFVFLFLFTLLLAMIPPIFFVFTPFNQSPIQSVGLECSGITSKNHNDILHSQLIVDKQKFLFLSQRAASPYTFLLLCCG